MRQPWSPPWRTTTTCGRSLPIARAEWSPGHIQACCTVVGHGMSFRYEEWPSLTAASPANRLLSTVRDRVQLEGSTALRRPILSAGRS
jgi:hypothetical protein